VPAIRRLAIALSLVGLASAAHAARPTIITGAVLDQGLRPLAGARVQVIGEDCATTTRPNGAFELSCGATGVRALEASFGELPPARIEGVELGPDRLAQLTFLVRPAAAPAPAPAIGLGAPLPNPVLTTWRGRPLTLRALGVVLAISGFVLGLAALLVVARRLGMNRRRLSEAEAADLVLNAGKALTDRVHVVAYGARGVEWSTSYGAEEIAAAVKARRWGLVLASLLAPVLIGVATLGFSLALLVGQPRYLFGLMLLVPAGFVVTPLVLVVQALRGR